MDDLISRQAAIDLYKRDYEGRYAIINAEQFEAMLTRVSSAQPEPKTARWVNVNEGKWNTVEVLKCTACGEIDNRMYRTDGYCPNCGAKMGGEDNATD